MVFFKKLYILRRYSRPEIVQGYASIPYEDITLPMDVQTTKDEVITTPDGNRSIQRLKVFSDSAIFGENVANQQKADRLWFQGKWFECRSSILSDNTPLKHWTAIFVECLDADTEPAIGADDKQEDGRDEFGGG